MTQVIDWTPNKANRATNFDNLTRNGFTKSCGIGVSRLFGTKGMNEQPYDEIHLESLSSTGELGKARIVVPIGKVSELIAALSALIADNPASEG